MTVPAYAAHLDQEAYEKLRDYWPYMGLACEGPRGFHFKKINTVADARTLLLIASQDKNVIEAMDKARPVPGFENDGRSIETIAALLQYHRESQEAVQEIVFGLKDNPYGLPAEAQVNLFCFLMECMRYTSDYNKAVTAALMDFADTLNIEPLVPFAPDDFRDAHKVLRCFSGIYARAQGTLEQWDKWPGESDAAVMQDKLLQAALRYIPLAPHTDGAWPFLRALHLYAHDQQILDLKEPLTRLYEDDMRRIWGYLPSWAEHDKISVEKHQAKSVERLRETFARDARGANIDFDGLMASVPLPAMTRYHIQYLRVVPGGLLLPAIDLAQKHPDIAACNWRAQLPKNKMDS